MSLGVTIAVARLNLNGSKQVAVGHGKLEVLAGAVTGPHSSDLEWVVAELDSDGFEQSAQLNAGGFGWVMVGLCKLKKQATVTAMKAESCARLDQGCMSEQGMRVLAAFDDCEKPSTAVRLTQVPIEAWAWVPLGGHSGSSVRIAYTKQRMWGRGWTNPTCLISIVRAPGLRLLGWTSVARLWHQLQLLYGRKRYAQCRTAPGNRSCHLALS